MSYVKQVCDGYNKKSLLGNWFEERLYPAQPFREQQLKQARSKDEGISCFDETGLQRLLPRIERRSKWETAGRIVLQDGYNAPVTTTQGSYNYKELATASQLTKEPFSKNLSQVFSTELHPHSQVRVHKLQHRLLNHSTIDEIRRDRSADLDKTHFRSKLPITSPHEKHTNYVSQYKLNFESPEENGRKEREGSGTYNQNPEERKAMKPLEDKSLIFGAREPVQELKQSSVPTNDIQTSLNMNIGIHNIHPKAVGDNYFRKITQSINSSPCDR